MLIFYALDFRVARQQVPLSVDVRTATWFCVNNAVQAIGANPDSVVIQVYIT